MQGRITKVLNMKPPEILGLLEEAAGTKMYETKKQAALRTLEKKQVKVDEINKVLSEDIMPALDKLRKEKVQYMEWQNASSNLERLERFCVAYKYMEAKSLQEDGEMEIQQAEEALSNYDTEILAVDIHIREKDDEIQGLQTEKELQSNGEIKELAQEVDDLSKRLVKENSQLTNTKEGLTTEKASCDQIATSLEDLHEGKLAMLLQKATEKRDAASADLEQAVAAVEAAQNELAGAEAGDGRDASNRSLQERLSAAQNAQTEAEAEAKASETRVKHLQKQLAEQKKNLTAKQKEGSKLEGQLQKEADAVQECKNKLDALNFDPDTAKALEAAVQEKRSHAQSLRDKFDELNSQLAAVNFDYKDPSRGFDRSKVKGVVAKLVRVQNPKTTTALEVAAGGKLYQVVVDSEQTAKALLSGGQLRSRVTIIPLNKVSYRPISSETLSAAQKLAGSKAQPAIELVGFDHDLSAAMQYVFGGSFVCNDAGTAKKLAFAADVKTRCVTLDGDDFNPGGTLTGGSRNKTNSVLTQLHALAEIEEKLEEQLNVLKAAEAELKGLTSAIAEHEKLSKQLDLKQHSYDLLQKRFEGSETHQLIQAVANSEKELHEAQEAVIAAKKRKTDLVDEAKSLEHEIANFGKEKDKHVKAAKAKLKAAKEHVEECKKGLKAAEAELQVALAEQETAAGERAALATQLEAAQATVVKIQHQIDELSAVVAATKQAHENAADRLQECRARLKECDAEISAATKARAGLEKHKTDMIVEKKKLGNKLEALRKGAHDAVDRCRILERDYPWINTERDHFGKPGSDYDWNANDAQEVFRDYERARTTIDSLAKKVNKKVMQMFEKAEQEYNELKRKKDVVETDKCKIQEVMDELDEKKREALHTTWQKVTGDLGSIFSTLLPGTMAKLEPEEGKSFMDGLEVRVAFGGVWKESLSELSGGQKSLLALSLILAMLLFKPAPIYILDEVDAALDLSHTQNIGRMIKAHFPQSQFIVVSLKEGMFNNANVIFRTKFVDGVSTVTRTINEHAKDDAGKKKQQQGAGKGRAALKENVAHA